MWHAPPSLRCFCSLLLPALHYASSVCPSGGLSTAQQLVPFRSGRALSCPRHFRADLAARRLAARAPTPTSTTDLSPDPTPVPAPSSRVRQCHEHSPVPSSHLPLCPCCCGLDVYIQLVSTLAALCTLRSSSPLLTCHQINAMIAPSIAFSALSCQPSKQTRFLCLLLGVSTLADSLSCDPLAAVMQEIRYVPSA